MKPWLLGIGLLLLPIGYIALMSFNEQPVEWYVVGLMALIVVPIFVFRKAITATEKKFDAMSGKEQLDAVVDAAKKVARRSGGIES